MVVYPVDTFGTLAGGDGGVMNVAGLPYTPTLHVADQGGDGGGIVTNPDGGPGQSLMPIQLTGFTAFTSTPPFVTSGSTQTLSVAQPAPASSTLLILALIAAALLV